MQKKQRIKNRLRLKRITLGYSQKDVCKILGFKRTNRISSWEKGKSMPNALNLLQLSILYRTLPAELYPEKYQSLREKIVQSEKAFQVHGGKYAIRFYDS